MRRITLSDINKLPQRAFRGYSGNRVERRIIPLTDEQNRVIEELQKGNSIVVDSCVGAGKTTVIQEVCNHFYDKRILYLTYNRLLKLDAQEKITNHNTTVQNYHGFVYTYLARRNLRVSPEKQIKTFLNKCTDVPLIYDIICIDEYQDLEEDSANLLLHLHQECPNAQWVFVGDMAQKIYDKTRIDVYEDCIDKIIPDYVPLQFTKCFRVNDKHAAMLSELWEKGIEGTNEDCIVSYTTSFREVLDLIDKYDNKDVLVIGPRYGLAPELVNLLERHNPIKYNKSTVWTSIRDRNDNTQMEPDSLIVTTYDGCKGMERKVCIVIDWTNHHYKTRVEKPFVDKQIITNLFCVAASRGKDRILFYSDEESGWKHFLTKSDLQAHYTQKLPDYSPSSMFDFKFQEDIADCISYLQLEQFPQEDTTEIQYVSRDKNIDLTPCIGMFQEISFFTNYNYEQSVERYQDTPINRKTKKFAAKLPELTSKQKALILTALDTGLFRYVDQVTEDFITDENIQILYNRLRTKLNPDATKIQVKAHLVAPQGFTVLGFIDYINESNIPVELKFVSALTSPHFLQAAMYSIMHKAPYAWLWNTRDNTLYKVSVKDIDGFLTQVHKTITQGRELRRT